MLLPDQTYEQANSNQQQQQQQQQQLQQQKHHQDYLRRSYDEFNRIIDLKEIDVKRLQRNIFDSGVVAEGEDGREVRPEDGRIPQQKVIVQTN
ncbi:probable serine/threonine-protein kinase PLK [Culex quinquefasciatus]|uniref:probable serine/threonine-protein kinase PLK n=1 Tax=Culex quinquefasciatus TaxID=7176 RepID=UPI0018E3F368|nr:probable serine/threonine-protein kinase PLK [Culex quinquefasciatus]